MFAGVHVTLSLDLPFYQSFPLFAGWMFACVYILSYIACIKLDKIVQLHYDCDIDNFLVLTNQLSQRCPGKTLQRTMELNLSAAHLMIGDNPAAGELLNKIGRGRFRKNRLGALQEFIFHNNSFAYYYNTGANHLAQHSPCIRAQYMV